MIDYNKLKKAHELAEKAIENGHKTLLIELNFCYGLASCDGHSLYLGSNGDDLEGVCINSIIDKLEELTKPKPKYEIGDLVWILNPEKNNNQEAISSYITSVFYDGDHYKVKTGEEIGGVCLPEYFCYPSRESLIESQVTYWLNMLGSQEQIKYFAKQAKPMDCEHEDEENAQKNDKDAHKDNNRTNGTAFRILDIIAKGNFSFDMVTMTASHAISSEIKKNIYEKCGDLPYGHYYNIEWRIEERPLLGHQCDEDCEWFHR